MSLLKNRVYALGCESEGHELLLLHLHISYIIKMKKDIKYKIYTKEGKSKWEFRQEEIKKEVEKWTMKTILIFLLLQFLFTRIYFLIKLDKTEKYSRVLFRNF